MNFLSLERYKRGRKLGEGSFGKVYQYSRRRRRSSSALVEDISEALGRLLGHGGQGGLGGHGGSRELEAVGEHDIAVKVLIGVDDVGFSKEDREWREVSILNNKHHPNIVRFFGLVKLEGKIGIAMELCRFGDLQALMESPRVLELSDVQHLIGMVVAGLEYLHSCRVVHRDIKPNNLLLQWCDDDDECVGGNVDYQTVRVRSLVIKITDFGLAKVMDTADASETMTNVGTTLYKAPELLRGDGRNDGIHYGARADVYSMGLVTYNIFKKDLRSLMSHSHYGESLGESILRRQSLPQSLQDFLSACLHPEPQQRSTSAQLLHHPFVAYDFLFENLDPVKFKMSDTVIRVHFARPDLIILGMHDGRIVMFDLVSMDRTEKVWHSDLVSSIASNGEFFAVGSWDHLVSVWRVDDNPELVSVVSEHTKWIESVHINADFLVTVGGDFKMCAFGTADWNKVGEVKVEAEELFLSGVSLSHEDNLVALFDGNVVRQFRLDSAEGVRQVSTTHLGYQFTEFSTPPESSSPLRHYWLGTDRGLAKISLAEEERKVLFVLEVGYVTQVKQLREFLLCAVTNCWHEEVRAYELRDLEECEKYGEDSVMLLGNVPFRRLPPAEWQNLRSNVETSVGSWCVAYSTDNDFRIVSVADVARLPKTKKGDERKVQEEWNEVDDHSPPKLVQGLQRPSWNWWRRRSKFATFMT